MSEVKLSAQPRREFGKGAARRLRREHLVPAVLYGHGTDPVHVALPGHATMLALKNANALLTIELEGKTQLALPKDVQRHPIRSTIEHVDLLIVRRGEKVTVEVPIHLTGDPAPDGLIQTELTSVSIEVEATHIPEGIEYSLEDAEIGTQVRASELTLPGGATLVTDGEAIIALVSDAQRASDTGEEPEAAAEGAEEAADEAPAPEEA